MMSPKHTQMERGKQIWTTLAQEATLRKPVHDFQVCHQVDIFGPLRTFTLPYHPLGEVGKGSIHLLKILEVSDVHHAAQNCMDKTHISKLGEKILKILDRGNKIK